jgi:hypothetical protein
LNPNRYRCPECRTRRTDFALYVLHCMRCPRKTCACGGYHHPHRPGSPCCVHNPLGTLHAAARAGESADVLLDIAADIGFDHPGTPSKECPF